VNVQFIAFSGILGNLTTLSLTVGCGAGSAYYGNDFSPVPDNACDVMGEVGELTRTLRAYCVCRNWRNQMLIHSAASATLPAVDIDRARKFYEDKLGLEVVKEGSSSGLMVQCGKGTSIYLYQRGATKADHTVVSFEVDDIKSEVNELKKRGVTFEEYDIPEMGIKTVNSIAVMDGEKAAWFKDTEGNILALGQWNKE
jgi:catechol 2,3-dioxygenase-like lactoylglutathione lyase family enzyme